MTHAEAGALHELPLFPLTSVLYPGALLPLRIFELRYLEMVGRCQREGRPFGVVALTRGEEVARPGPEGYAPEAFREVGTLAEIDHLERPQPGLMAIRCRATRRFRLRSHERRERGLWVGDAELLPDDPAVEIPEDLEQVALTLQALLRELQARADAADALLPFAAPFRFDDCGWVAFRWCELLPLQPAVKQQLLETDSPLLRLELVADLLDGLKTRVA